MRAAPLREITPEETEAFHRDGAVVVRGVLPQEWVDLAGKGLDDAISQPDVLSENLGTLRVDQFPAARSKGLRRIVEESPVAEIVGRALRSPVRFYMDQLFYKPEGWIPPTPWHQDTCYYQTMIPRPRPCSKARSPADPCSGRKPTKTGPTSAE
jgi:hypothetical protein